MIKATRKWLIIKISSGLLIPFMAWFIINLVTAFDANNSQLIVSSVCIEDVSEDAGPLSYWPKSHVCPPWLNSNGTTHTRTSSEHDAAIQYFLKYAEQNKLTPQSFKGEIGDVFIWHQQLYHGGLPIIDKKKTRRSLVNHYWSFQADELPLSYVPVNSCSGFLKRKHKV